MPSISDNDLIKAACAVSANAVSPYSKIRVGAALRTKDGSVVSGANVESASYGLTCCAERIALFAALSLGHREFTEIALVSSVTPKLLPCGACRQLLSEYAGGIRIQVASLDNLQEIDEYDIAQLMPLPLTDLPE